MGAAQRLFDCFELAEQIFFQLVEAGGAGTLLRAQSVCRHWRDIIRNSKPIQRRLCYLPDHNSSHSLSELGYELNSALPPEWTSRYHLWEGVVHLTIEWDDLCRWMVNRRFESWSKMLVSRPPKPYCVSTFVGSNKPEEDLWPLCQDDHESEYLDGTVPLGEAIAMCYITGQRALDEIPTMPWNSGWDDDEHAVACSCRIVNSIALDRLMDKNGHVPPDEDELQEIRRWERVFLGLEAVDEGASPP
ncbi:hypothetical protein HDK64DRAFT_83822 [Phyllosticta capitalensis]